jgi:WD40 repeat protein
MRIARRGAVLAMLTGLVVMMRGHILAVIGVGALCFVLLMTFGTLQENIRHRRRIKRAERHLVHAQFTTDGQIITISLYNVVRLVDVETGRLVKTFRRSPSLTHFNTRALLVAYSGDGRYVVYGWVEGDGAGTSVYCGESLSPTLTEVCGSGEYASSLVVSSDGELVGYVDEFGRITLRDRRTGKQMPWVEGAFSNVEAVALGSNGRQFAVGMGDTVYWVHVMSGEIVRMFEGVGPVSSIAFSPDGRYFAVGGDVLIRVWNCTNGELVQTVEAGGLIENISFSPDARYIACFEIYGISLWDVKREACLWRRHLGNGSLKCFSFSSDSRQLIGLANGGRVYCWCLDGEGRLTSTQILSENGWVR